MKPARPVAAILIGLLSLTQIATAQDDDICSTIVQVALDITRETCDPSTGHNQACYGNATVRAEAQAGVSELVFEQPGDIVDVEAIRTLQLSSMNRDANEWGMAYLRVQANLPDDSAESVTLLLFGAVTIENAVEPLPDPTTLEITATGNINVRGGASTSDDVVGNLTTGQTVVADGRLADSSWLRIKLDEGGSGWVFTQLMTVDGDIETLDIVEDGSVAIEPEFLPRHLRETGLDDARVTPFPMGI
jgi:hypothetical protein